LPLREAHDALSDAVMAGLAFLKLRRLLNGSDRRRYAGHA
jgi:hypothetical protein